MQLEKKQKQEAAAAKAKTAAEDALRPSAEGKDAPTPDDAQAIAQARVRAAEAAAEAKVRLSSGQALLQAAHAARRTEVCL